MFKTFAGPVEEDATVAYLRPETAQGMFVNFLNVLQTTRKKPPFGIAQVGKSFRNEITPQNFVFRTREFEQMEMEYFVPPAEADTGSTTGSTSASAGISTSASPPSKLRLRHHDTDELSHYSAATADVEFLFPWGWDELEGIANRTDFDLKAHAAALGREARVLRPGDRRALRALRHRAGGRRHPDHDGLPPGRLRRGRGRGEKRSVLRLASPSGPVPGGRAPAVEEGHPGAAGRRGPGARCSPSSCATRRDPVHRQALPPSGRGRYARAA